MRGNSRNRCSSRVHIKSFSHTYEVSGPSSTPLEASSGTTLLVVSTTAVWNAPQPRPRHAGSCDRHEEGLCKVTWPLSLDVLFLCQIERWSFFLSPFFTGGQFVRCCSVSNASLPARMGCNRMETRKTGIVMIRTN